MRCQFHTLADHMKREKIGLKDAFRAVYSILNIVFSLNKTN